MKIHGKYKFDDNFTTVYADNDRVYTIARKTGDWGSLKVGDRAYYGGVVTREWFDNQRSKCEREGTFELD